MSCRENLSNAMWTPPCHRHVSLQIISIFPLYGSKSKVSICAGCVTASARKPPYLQTQVPCPGLEGAGLGSAQEQTLDNLCGDLNKGYLPVNPIGQNVLGVSYPFELIKNKTLDFFSKTLPILKADDTLPKVAKYQDSHIMYNPTIFNSQVNIFTVTVNIFT